MNGHEKLAEYYARAGNKVELREIQKIYDNFGYRVGLPGYVVARTLDAEIANFLASLEGSEILATEEDVLHYIAGRLRDQISQV